MPKMNKNKKSSGLAPEGKIVIKQQEDYKTRYTSALAPASQIVIKQSMDYSDRRY